MADAENKWDATTLRRLPSIQSMPVSKLEPSPWSAGPDPRFTQVYLEFLQGKRNAYETRMSLSRLKCGFYRRGRGETQAFHCDGPPSDLIEGVAESIRHGHRPAIFVYDNPNKSDAERYLAPDDVAVFKAYESLGVHKVPVVSLMRPRGPLEESVFEVRAYRPAEEGARVCLASVIPGASGDVPALIGKKSPEEAVACLEHLRKRIGEARDAVKNFHKPGEEIHYHHTLHSTLFRLDETLNAVTMLLAQSLWYQAVPLLRALYETALTFYVDWLAPTRMAPYLALSSIYDNEEIREYAKKTAIVERPGSQPFVDSQVEKATLRTFELVRNVREKANLSPLGIQFYENMYSFMSRVAHQDFEIVANFARTLEQPERPQFERHTLVSLLLSADVIVAMVVLRILDDVGSKPPADSIAAVDG